MNAAQATTKNESESGPERATSATRKLVIRRKDGLWILYDDEQKIGGIFLSLDVAVTYARREPAYATGAACITVVGDTETRDQRHAA